MGRTPPPERHRQAIDGPIRGKGASLTPSWSLGLRADAVDCFFPDGARMLPSKHNEAPPLWEGLKVLHVTPQARS